MSLEILWFTILGVLLTGYAILDGFDLGVGILHPFVRGETERRLALNSIGPLWDGNEVWFVTFGGALFAAFPEAYATILSSMYFPIVLILFGLIGRAISIEFRSKRESKLWRAYWDASFFASSAMTTFLFGLCAGNAIYGIPLDARGEYAGGVSTLLSPYPIAVGCFCVATAAMHGSIFLYLKTEGELQARARAWMWRSYFVFAALYAIVTALTLLWVPHATDNFARWPAAWIVVVLNALAILNIPRALHKDRAGYAFFSSSCLIAALVFLFGMALFPNLVVSRSQHASLTIVNAASSQHTLGIMAVIAAIGIPFVATYTAIVYWIFRGKVKLEKTSY
jgi:cytochrome bd ubiquinol oxidase subunit II